MLNLAEERRAGARWASVAEMRGGDSPPGSAGVGAPRPGLAAPVVATWRGRGGQWRLQAVASAVMDKDLHPRLCLSGARGTVAGICRGRASEKARQTPLLQHSTSLGRGGQCWEKGEQERKGDRARSGPNIKASAPMTWGQTPPQIGQ